VILALVLALAGQASQSWEGGTIVDIRANIVQIRLGGNGDLSRVVLTPKTRIDGVVQAGPESLALGDRAFSRGAYDPIKGFHPSMVRVFKAGPNDGPPQGLGGDSYSQQFDLEGTVTSLSPLTLSDAKGHAFPLSGNDFKVVKEVDFSRDRLKVGTFAYFGGDKTPDGLTAVSEVFIPPADREVTLHGKVLKVEPNLLTLTDQYSDQPDAVSLGPETSYFIATDVDPESIKVGDAVSVVGLTVRGSSSAPEELMSSTFAVGSYVHIPLPEDDPGSSRVELRGVLTSISPCVLHLANGRDVVIDVAGNTLFQVCRAALPADIRVGDWANVTEKFEQGKYVVKTVILRRKT
jgi:hypothetical protein